jgi:hypothetical protein
MSWSYGYTPGKLGFKLGEVLVGLKAGTTDVPEALKTDDGRMHIVSYSWDSGSLSWVVSTTRGAGVGQEVYVTNLSSDLAVQLDVASSTVTYVGKADAGTASSAASWKIFRMTTASDGDLSLEYADGNASFDNVWDDRTSLNYS